MSRRKSIILLFGCLTVLMFFAFLSTRLEAEEKKELLAAKEEKPLPLQQILKNYKVAYEKDKDLWIMRGDGSDERKLTDTKKVLRAEYWIKDGQYLLYLEAWPISDKNTIFKYWIINIKTKEKKQLPDQGLTIFGYSNSLNKLLCQSEKIKELILLDPFSFEKKVIAQFEKQPTEEQITPEIYDAKLSPDEKSLAITVVRGAGEFLESSDIAVLDLVSGKIRYLTQPPLPAKDYQSTVINKNPYWVNEGSFILFMSDRSKDERGGKLDQYWLIDALGNDARLHSKWRDLREFSFDISSNGNVILLSYGSRAEHGKVPIKDRKIFLMDWNGKNYKELVSRGWMALARTERFFTYVTLNNQKKEESYIFDLKTMQTMKFPLYKTYNIWWPRR